MKNSDITENTGQGKGNSQNQSTGPKNNNSNTNPYDSENLDQESDASSKDITEKDIEKDLIENDPSQGFETDIEKDNNNEARNAPFETIDPGVDNPVNKEFEVGGLNNEQLQEDELTRDESDNGAVHFNKPSERKF